MPPGRPMSRGLFTAVTACPAFARPRRHGQVILAYPPEGSRSRAYYSSTGQNGARESRGHRRRMAARSRLGKKLEIEALNCER